MRLIAIALLLVTACATAPARAPWSPEADAAAARALFEENLRAIQDKDRDAYLACYRQSERLVRAGDTGVKLGFAELAAGTSSVASDWPSALEVTEMTVHPVAPGVVYGSYKYRVTIEGATTEGWSERVFVEDPDGWRIAVTTAFAD